MLLDFDSRVRQFQSTNRAASREHRKTAMAGPVLVRRIEFRCGQTKAGDVRQRVITRSTGATGRLDDLAVASRIDDDRLGVFSGAEGNDDAGGVRRTLGHAGQAPGGSALLL